MHFARRLYTGGSDGFIRAYDTAKGGDEPKLVEYFKDGVTSLDCSVRNHACDLI